jgi:DNA polymerase-3 subunit delta
MKASGRKLESLLADPDPKLRVFLVYGADRGGVRERAAMLAARLVPDLEDPFAVTRLTEDDLKSDPARLADSLVELSLTGADRLVTLRLSGDSAPVAKTIDAVARGDIRAEAALIIETGELRKTARLRKACEDADLALAAPVYVDAPGDLARLADTTLAEQGLSLEPDARAALAPLLEGDRLFARSELEKLMLYKGLREQREEGDVRIDRADVLAICAAGSDAAIDQCVDAAMEGAITDADRSYARALAAGLSPVAVLRGLQRKIDQFDAFASGGEGALARSGAPRFGPPAERFKRAARLWTPPRLARARALAFQAEREVKRTGAPAEALVGQLVLRLARAAAPAGRR